ncbi:ATP-binding protein [Georgenia satyanarayanai]|uniref:ATP-binding protein n=1 Tax=Georgenia satyanarayanai TaxID=860221 RepID=UPI0012651D91|nr:ATP-binding protein [Georgenia satyanarayanai]
MAGEHRRTGLALPAALSEVHALFAEVAAAHPGLTVEDVMRVETALIELVGNIVEHGRPSGGVRYTLEVAVSPGEVVAHLADDAREPAPGAADHDMPDEWAETGRGLALAGALVDELVHEAGPTGNRWQITQRRTGGTPG